MPTIDLFSLACGFLLATALPIIDIISVWILSKRR